MSRFIWGKIKLNALPDNFNCYRRGDILVYFALQKDDIYLSDLGSKEIYFNIACGYNEMIYPHHDTCCLNCDDSFFSINFPKRSKHKKRSKQITNLEPYFSALHQRLKRLQKVIEELYERPEVDAITLFHTETGTEFSIEEYCCVNWKINEFADNFYNEIIAEKGLSPSIKVVFQK